MISPNFKLFALLAFFMAIMVTASNFLVQFPVNHLGMENLLTYGAFSYPITFFITDLATDDTENLLQENCLFGFFLEFLQHYIFQQIFQN